MPPLSQPLSHTLTSRGHASIRESLPPALTGASRWPWLATGGRGWLATVLARCTIARQLRTAARPLLLAAARPRGHWKRILIPLDFSAASQAAASLAARIDAQLVFLACYTASDAAAQKAGEEMRLRLSHFVQQLDIRHDRVSVVVRRGGLEAATRSYAALMRADLVVFGLQPARALTDYLAGRTEWHLAREIGSDLLVVPA